MGCATFPFCHSFTSANSGKKDYIYGSIDIVCKSKTIDKEIVSLKNFIIKSSKEFHAEFGYLHPIYNEKEFESFVAADINLYSNFQNPSLYISSFKIKKCIPNLFWFTIFGPTYVNFFGKAKIETIPCYKISKLSNKLYAIQLTKDILDLKNNFQEFDEIRNKAKKHLGLNAFFNPVLKPDFKYETPKFPSGFAENKISIESIDFENLQKSLKGKKIKIINFDK
ncbi:hypothetical protein [Leptospira harrisiae]|uniref:hypothetical protein n=1 Tax=Leptospira harrisiae TaxID=2023189 RepID=UPI000C2AC0B5|nr:hypothetical protein [Leptospira harrisiae]PKA06455.1 hypothetical protein CH366_18990 [Leptospira harrisiae]